MKQWNALVQFIETDHSKVFITPMEFVEFTLRYDNNDLIRLLQVVLTCTDFTNILQFGLTLPPQPIRAVDPLLQDSGKSIPALAYEGASLKIE